MNEREAIEILQEEHDYAQLLSYVNSALNLAISALEKQIPKKPKILTWQPLIDSGWKYECPNCGCAVGENKYLSFAYEEYLEPYENYCPTCGQAIDWS